MSLGIWLKKFHLINVGAFGWASKFALFSVTGLKDEKLILKKKTYIKTETCKLYSRVFWIFLPNVIKSIIRFRLISINFELYRSKVGAYFETQCIV